MTFTMECYDPESDSPNTFPSEFEVTVDTLAEYLTEVEIMEPVLKPFRQNIVDGLAVILVEYFTEEELQKVVDGLEGNELFEEYVYDASQKK